MYSLGLDCISLQVSEIFQEPVQTTLRFSAARGPRGRACLCSVVSGSRLRRSLAVPSWLQIIAVTQTITFRKEKGIGGSSSCNWGCKAFSKILSDIGCVPPSGTVSRGHLCSKELGMSPYCPRLCSRGRERRQCKLTWGFSACPLLWP